MIAKNPMMAEECTRQGSRAPFSCCFEGDRSPDTAAQLQICNEGRARSHKLPIPKRAVPAALSSTLWAEALQVQDVFDAATPLCCRRFLVLGVVPWFLSCLPRSIPEPIAFGFTGLRPSMRKSTGQTLGTNLRSRCSSSVPFAVRTSTEHGERGTSKSNLQKSNFGRVKFA